MPEDFALKNREHSSSLGYLIPTLNVTRAKKRKRYEINEQEQFSRILNIEQETFTPLVFSATRAMGRECSMFVKKLSRLISIKRKEELSLVTYGIRCKISFALLRSCLSCIRGSRKSNNKY